MNPACFAHRHMSQSDFADAAPAHTHPPSDNRTATSAGCGRVGLRVEALANARHYEPRHVEAALASCLLDHLARHHQVLQVSLTGVHSSMYQHPALAAP